MQQQTSTEEHWTLKPSLQQYFFSASIIATVFFFLGVLANIHEVTENMIPLSIRIAIAMPVGLIAAMSALLLWVGMLSYWWQVDRPRRGMKIFWLFALSLGNWVGAIIYYFIVFRPILTGQRGLQES